MNRATECYECGETVTNTQGVAVCQECRTTIGADERRSTER